MEPFRREFTAKLAAQDIIAHHDLYDPETDLPDKLYWTGQLNEPGSFKK